jgi:hypothetical protein
MRTAITENKSVVIRQKMKSAFAKVLLAAKARGTAKEKAQQAFAALAEFGFVEGFERQSEAQDLSDKASLVAMALLRLSPACARVAVTGLPHTITVPNSHTAEVFRAAIAESAKQRPSDRLVRIVVADH